jgi:hypothetical protein
MTNWQNWLERRKRRKYTHITGSYYLAKDKRFGQVEHSVYEKVANKFWCIEWGLTEEECLDLIQGMGHYYKQKPRQEMSMRT